MLITLVFIDYQMIEILLVLHSAHIVLRDKDKFIIYINNYIDWNQFNQLYDLDWIEKDIRNTDIFTYKLRPALTKAVNQRLNVAKKKRQKTKPIAAKC